MATSTITGVMALLKAKMEALQIGGLDVFGAVSDFANGDFEGYPACMITEIGGKGETMDTHRNQRTHEFMIRLYQEQSRAGKTKEDAATKMRSVCDAVLAALDTDKTLSGEVDIVRVVEFETSFKVTAGTFNFASFRVQVAVLVLNHN
ncbi:MAG: hypothetical protein WA082_04440 [Candidatus Moraniibacteriota bacterium]